jgi:phosphopantothenate-cysteine ligase
MDQVPKILKPMVDEWTRDGFIVSFKVLQHHTLRLYAFPDVPSKLETDPALLIPKSRAALERYGHQVVIGNDLHRRKYEVVFVERRASKGGLAVNATADDPDPMFTENWLRLAQPQSPPGIAGPDAMREIEEDIVRELIKRHQAWMEQGLSTIVG